MCLLSLAKLLHSQEALHLFTKCCMRTCKVFSENAKAFKYNFSCNIIQINFFSPTTCPRSVPEQWNIMW